MIDLFEERLSIKIPERSVLAGRFHNQFCKRLLATATEYVAQIAPLSSTAVAGFRVELPDGTRIAIVDRKTTSSVDSNGVLLVPSIESSAAVRQHLAQGRSKWLFPRPLTPSETTVPMIDAMHAAIKASWRNALRLKSEVLLDGAVLEPGLRTPQVGAIHAAQAHWSVTSNPATLVMPTGTGKTETMLSLLVAEQIPRLLVIVPTDQLRVQLSTKFLSLGVLKASGCLSQDALLPIVTTLHHVPKSLAEVDAIFGASQVIVSTMKVLTSAPRELQERVAEHVSHLFVDEAHHIGANTWREFKSLFSARRVLQFTATPYRNDGRRLDGKFIYVYPLRKAQQEGLFRSIRYLPVHGRDADASDDLIIERVGEQLKIDLDSGSDHLVMARTDSVDRAVALHQKYALKLPQHHPRLIHSKMPGTSRMAALGDLRARVSRIIVCVDMLGEGFDLPELKIAALHDKHRSEGVTLQFVGRFTRARSDLGDATVIANVALDEVSARLKSLFAEDADWNRLLSVIGESKIERERSREDLFSGFVDQPENFPIETFEPRMSAVVYRTSCQAWRPEMISDALPSGSSIVEGPLINHEHHLAVFVTKDEERLRWTRAREPQNIEYNLTMAHWDEDTGLLYINSSNLDDLHANLAEAIGGEGTSRVSGEVVFRVLYGFRRLVLSNLGLRETQRRPVRYSMFMGSDIADQLDTLPGNRQRTISNLFGQGYVDEHDLGDDGLSTFHQAARETIGCSTKGRIWSYKTTNSLREWIDWCHSLGAKLLNDNITNEAILRGVVRPKRQQSRPTGKVPIAIAWPERFLQTVEDRIEIEVGDTRLPFFDCEIDIIDYSDRGPIRFKVGGDRRSAEFELSIADGVSSYKQRAGSDVLVHRSRKTKRLLEVFKEDPPHIYFSDGDMLVDSDLFVLPQHETRDPFDPKKIEALDWTGVDIRKEAQGPGKSADSIQRFVINRLLSASPEYEIIFDDDGSGEVADVVAIHRSGWNLRVELFHCKYSSEATPGARVHDLYEVCGQAQKSVRWAERRDEFLKHLKRREAAREASVGTSRFERGDVRLLTSLISDWRQFRVGFAVTVVQPGFSKAQANAAHLELFAATESFLMETWRIPFRVFASP